MSVRDPSAGSTRHWSLSRGCPSSESPWEGWRVLLPSHQPSPGCPNPSSPRFHTMWACWHHPTHLPWAGWNSCPVNSLGMECAGAPRGVEGERVPATAAFPVPTAAASPFSACSWHWRWHLGAGAWCCEGEQTLPTALCQHEGCPWPLAVPGHTPALPPPAAAGQQQGMEAARPSSPPHLQR